MTEALPINAEVSPATASDQHPGLGPTSPPTVASATGPANRLLAAITGAAQARLATELVPVTLAARDLLHNPGEPIDTVYFPLTAVTSTLTLLTDGSAVEAAVVGNEGLVGLPLALGLESDVNRVINQVPGRALRLTAELFLAALAREPRLRQVVQRFTQVLLQQMSQSAACNRMHPLEERCARWLLLTYDRVGGADTFALTQEFLASMLGVRRPSVTVAAGMLQHAGFIDYQRGRITIVDRAGLEASACECYATITATTNQILGPPLR